MLILMKENSDIESAFISFSSCNKLNQYAKENLKIVDPVEYILNNDDLNAKPCSVQYVPILETLKNLLFHEDVFSYVINHHKSNDHILRDICDGHMYSNNEFFTEVEINYKCFYFMMVLLSQITLDMR